LVNQSTYISTLELFLQNNSGDPAAGVHAEAAYRAICWTLRNTSQNES
jgi:hypothetical protein